MSDGDEIQQERLKRGWSQAELAEHARRFVDERDRQKLVQQVVDRVEAGRQSKYRNAVLQALDLPLVFLNACSSAQTNKQEEGTSMAAPQAAGFAALFQQKFRDEFGRDASVQEIRNALVHGAPAFHTLSGPRDVEELGVAVGGDNGDFELNGEVISLQPRPPGLMARDVFAVRVQNDSMYPRFKDGELVYVERKREPAVGEDAIIEMIPAELFSPGAAFIKEIAKKSPSQIVARQHNPKRVLNFQRSQIKALYRVVPWNECFGV